MPKTVKKGPFEIFYHPFCCKISEKIEGDFENFQKKKQNENF